MIHKPTKNYTQKDTHSQQNDKPKNARRGEEWYDSESRRMLEHAIDGRGGCYLRLTPEQYRKLRRYLNGKSEPYSVAGNVCLGAICIAMAASLFTHFSTSRTTSRKIKFPTEFPQARPSRDWQGGHRATP
jgi:hypothetical protein